ncbi:MAG: glycerate kinase [Niabella sp.]
MQNHYSIQNAVEIFTTAIAAVKPSRLIPANILLQDDTLTICSKQFTLPPEGKVHIMGAGKAAAFMAKEMENILGETLSGGIVITKYQHKASTQKIKIIEAAHPIPDENGVKATDELLAYMQKIKENDIVFFLLSGGASALLIDLPSTCSLNDVQQTFDLLLKSGADIEELNTVRKHLSSIKGGQLAQRIFPAKIITVIISDIINDPIDMIGSGPTVADCTTFENAYQIIEKYSLQNRLPASISKHLQDGLEKKIKDTPKPGAPCFNNTFNFIIGNNLLALQAAKNRAINLGYETFVMENALQGEARTVGKKIAGDIINYSGKLPVCFIYGGETTVTVLGQGKGGRNQELALAAGIEIQQHKNICIVCAGTDGTDGPTDVAGAFVNRNIMQKARQLEMNPAAFLNNNDSYHFFEPLHALLQTGHTQTNVMDIVIAIKET